jgi:integrase
MFRNVSKRFVARDLEPLPVALGAAQVTAVLQALHSPVYRVLFTTVYGTGLRIREACAS